MGDPAPDFELPDPDGRPRRLSEFRGRPVVLYFYPQDFTTVCTIEACTFRDRYEDLRRCGAEVVGVSPDPPAKHERFRGRYRLPYLLLSDVDGRVRHLYGVVRSWLVLRGRVTFVIDRDGIVRRRFSSQFRGRTHVKEALEALGALGASPAQVS